MKGVHYDLQLLITCLMLMIVHRNISERVTMGEKSTSNDNSYYYCSRGVGEVVNPPHVECFPFICLALAVNIAL